MDTKSIENQINEKFNNLLNEGKINFIPTEDEKLNKLNYNLHDENTLILLAKVFNIYFEDATYVCSKCNQEKKRKDYFKNIKYKTGIESQCKSCHMDYKKQLKMKKG